MDKLEAIDLISNGNLIECTKEEYVKEIRTALQEQAGKWIDSGDHIRAIITLNEVKRLDEILN